jgi:uncharacterized protein (TIGR02996 family)
MVSASDLSSLIAAIQANPSDSTTRLILADAYEERGDTEEAAEQRALAGLTVEDRSKALASYLEMPEEDIDSSHYASVGFGTGSGDYLVLTDDEAEARARETAQNDLWALGAEYLADYIPVANRRVLVKAIKAIQEKCSEDANEVLSLLLGSNLDDLLDSAISADGRGHFLSGYDGEENEVSYNGISLYIYRVN